MENKPKFYQRAVAFLILAVAVLLPWKLRIKLSDKLFWYNKKKKGKLDEFLFG